MKKRAYLLSKMAAVAVGIGIIAISLYSDAQAFSPSNSSRYLGNGRWDWTVFIIGSEEALRNIECVEYTLHPTFPNPIQKICNRGTGPEAFAFEANGWGVFEIKIKIILRNGESRPLSHMLTFKPSEGEVPLSIKADSEIHDSLSPGNREFEIFITGPVNDLNQIQCVKYTFLPKFRSDIETPATELREECNRGTGLRAFVFKSPFNSIIEKLDVDILVFLKNGRVQKLKHLLVF